MRGIEPARPLGVRGAIADRKQAALSGRRGTGSSFRPRSGGAPGQALEPNILTLRAHGPRSRFAPEPAQPLGEHDQGAGQVAAVDGRDVPGRQRREADACRTS